MRFALLVQLTLQVSVALAVLGIALRASADDLVYLLRRPSLFARSLIAMHVVMPALAVAIAIVCDLRAQLEAALILLAISPVPPIVPGKVARIGGNTSYAVGLLAVSAGLAIVIAPASLAVLGRVFGRSLHVPIEDVVAVVGSSVLAPLVAGVAIHRLVPALAARIARPVAILGVALLLPAFAVIVASRWESFAGEVGNFTLVAIVLFALASVAVGHVFGGPHPGDRTVLALSNARRHPGIALAIANVNARDPKAAMTTLLLCFIVSLIATIPYSAWRKRSQAANG